MACLEICHSRKLDLTYYPLFFQRKKGIMCYRPLTRPSAMPLNFSYSVATCIARLTIDARIIKLTYMHDSHMHTDDFATKCHCFELH